jgi:hypothetical protein
MPRRKKKKIPVIEPEVLPEVLPSVIEQVTPKEIDKMIENKKMYLKQKKELIKLAKTDKELANLEKDLKLVDIIDGKLELILDKITPDLIEQAKLKDLTVAAGILIDKKREILRTGDDEDTGGGAKKQVKLRVLWDSENKGVEIVEGG